MAMIRTVRGEGGAYSGNPSVDACSEFTPAANSLIIVATTDWSASINGVTGWGVTFDEVVDIAVGSRRFNVFVGMMPASPGLDAPLLDMGGTDTNWTALVLEIDASSIDTTGSAVNVLTGAQPALTEQAYTGANFGLGVIGAGFAQAFDRPTNATLVITCDGASTGTLFPRQTGFELWGRGDINVGTIEAHWKEAEEPLPEAKGPSYANMAACAFEVRSAAPDVDTQGLIKRKIPHRRKPSSFTPINSASGLTEGMVLLLSHAENGGNTVRDSTRYRNDFDTVNGATFGTDAYGRYLYLDGTDDHLTQDVTAGHPIISVDTALTIMVKMRWLQTGGAGRGILLSATRPGNSDAFHLDINASLHGHDIEVEIASGTASAATIGDSNDRITPVWAVVRWSNLGSGTLNVYMYDAITGELIDSDSSATHTGNLSYDLTDQVILIDHFATVYAERHTYFTGLWNRQLSLGEVHSIMENEHQLLQPRTQLIPIDYVAPVIQGLIKQRLIPRTSQPATSAPKLNKGHPLAKDLVLYLPMHRNNGIAGTNHVASVYDYSIHQHTFNSTGVETEFMYALAGNVRTDRGWAVNFGGDTVNDAIRVDDSDVFDVTNLSISMWVRPTNQGTTQTLFDKNFNTGYRARMTTGGAIEFLIEGGTNNFTSTGTIPENEWTHLAFVGDANGICEIYINGVVDPTTGTAYTSPPGGTDFLFIAQGGDGSSFIGDMQNVKMWDRALSPGEVHSDFVRPWHLLQPIVTYVPISDAAVGGGGDQTGDWTEGLDLTDAFSAVVTALASVTTNTDYGDTEAATAVALASVSNGVNLSDTESATKTVIADFTAGIDAGDSDGSTTAAIAALLENVDLSDAESALAVAAAALSAGLDAGETWAAAAVAIADISAATDFGDTYAGTVIPAGSVAGALLTPAEYSETFAAVSVAVATLTAGLTADDIMDGNSIIQRAWLAGTTSSVAFAAAVTAVSDITAGIDLTASVVATASTSASIVASVNLGASFSYGETIGCLIATITLVAAVNASTTLDTAVDGGVTLNPAVDGSITNCP